MSRTSTVKALGDFRTWLPPKSVMYTTRGPSGGMHAARSWCRIQGPGKTTSINPKMPGPTHHTCSILCGPQGRGRTLRDTTRPFRQWRAAVLHKSTRESGFSHSVAAKQHDPAVAGHNSNRQWVHVACTFHHMHRARAVSRGARCICCQRLLRPFCPLPLLFSMLSCGASVCTLGLLTLPNSPVTCHDTALGVTDVML